MRIEVDKDKIDAALKWEVQSLEKKNARLLGKLREWAEKEHKLNADSAAVKEKLDAIKAFFREHCEGDHSAEYGGYA